MKPINSSTCDNERGSGTALAMAFCVAAIAAYLKWGEAFFAAHEINPKLRLIALVCLAIITVFTLGCAIHLVFCGDKSKRQLRKELRRQIAELEEFITDTRSRIAELEQQSFRFSAYIRPAGVECLGNAKRILNAISQRVDEVSRLLESNSQIDLIDAHEMLRERLGVVENCVDSLIGGDPVPELEPELWIPTVNQLIDAVHLEIERVAA